MMRDHERAIVPGSLVQARGGRVYCDEDATHHDLVHAGGSPEEARFDPSFMLFGKIDPLDVVDDFSKVQVISPLDRVT